MSLVKPILIDFPDGGGMLQSMGVVKNARIDYPDGEGKFDIHNKWMEMKPNEIEFCSFLEGYILELYISGNVEGLRTTLETLMEIRVEFVNNKFKINEIIADGRNRVGMNKKRMTDNEEYNIIHEHEDIGSQFCTSIMQNTIHLDDSVPADMKVLVGVVNLETSTAQHIQKVDIVIRNNTEPFWESCLEVVDAKDNKNDRTRVCAIGAPGIGKTTSTAYLIRMLLMRNVHRDVRTKVVYHLCKPDHKGFCYEFIVDPIKIGLPQLTVYRELDFNELILSLMESETYYIVDPGVTDYSCNPSQDFQAKVIIICSPNSKHWGGSSFTKYNGWNTGGLFRYMPVWNRDEIIRSHPTLSKNNTRMTIGELHDRYDRVGGIVSHLFFSDTMYDSVLNEQNRARNILTFDQIWSIVTGDCDALNTFDGNIPKSSVVVYNDPYNNYSSDIVTAVSKVSLIESFMKYKARIYKKLDNQLTNNNDTEIIEAYVMADIATGMNCHVRSGVGKSDAERDKISKLIFPPVPTFKRTSKCLLEMTKQEQPMILFLSTNSKYPLYNLCYKDMKGKYHLFQITIGDTHSCNINELQELNKKRIELRIPDNNMNLYYIVQHHHFKNFVTYPVDPRNQTKGINVWHLISLDPNNSTK